MDKTIRGNFLHTSSLLFEPTNLKSSNLSSVERMGFFTSLNEWSEIQRKKELEVAGKKGQFPKE